MSTWGRLGISICIAIAITVLAYGFYDAGGEFFTLPGVAVELYLLRPIYIVYSADARLPIANRYIFNIAFYSILTFVLISVFIKFSAWRKQIRHYV